MSDNANSSSEFSPGGCPGAGSSFSSASSDPPHSPPNFALESVALSPGTNDKNTLGCLNFFQIIRHTISSLKSYFWKAYFGLGKWL